MGGGSFENHDLASHKECRKLKVDKGKFSLQLMASCKYQRNGHGICALGQKFVVVTGTRIGNGKTVEMYSVKDNSWEDLPHMNSGRYYHSSASFNEAKVFVFCGLEATTKKYLDTIEFLDVANKAQEWQVFEV